VRGNKGVSKRSGSIKKEKTYYVIRMEGKAPKTRRLKRKKSRHAGRPGLGFDQMEGGVGKVKRPAREMRWRSMSNSSGKGRREHASAPRERGRVWKRPDAGEKGGTSKDWERNGALGGEVRGALLDEERRSDGYLTSHKDRGGKARAQTWDRIRMIAIAGHLVRRRRGKKNSTKKLGN